MRAPWAQSVTHRSLFPLLDYSAQRSFEGPRAFSSVIHESKVLRRAPWAQSVTVDGPPDPEPMPRGAERDALIPLFSS